MKVIVFIKWFCVWMSRREIFVFLLCVLFCISFVWEWCVLSSVCFVWVICLFVWVKFFFLVELMVNIVLFLVLLLNMIKFIIVCFKFICKYVFKVLVFKNYLVVMFLVVSVFFLWCSFWIWVIFVNGRKIRIDRFKFIVVSMLFVIFCVVSVLLIIGGVV